MLKQCRRVALGALLAGAMVASAAPAFAASKPVASSANALRSAGAKVVITVDGQVVKPGQVVKGRNVEARITLPQVKLAKPTAVSLVDYQTTTFDLAKSNQRFLQADSTRLRSGTTVLNLELHCKTPGCRGYNHQLDVVVGPTIIGAATPLKWLGTYPHYSGKELLAGRFVRVVCKKSAHPHRHHKSRKPKCDSRCKG